MRRILLSFVVLGMVSGCASRQMNDADKAVLHLRIGTAHLQKGNHPAALRELLTAYRLDSENPVVANNLGLAYFVRGKYSTAKKFFAEAIELEPKYTEARNNLGRALLEVGQYDEAIRQLRIAADDLTYSSPQKSYSNLGIALFLAGNYPEAKVELKKSLRIQKNHCQTYNYYGRTLYKLNAFKGAAAAFDRAISLCKKSKYDEPVYYSALAYYKIGDSERATARLEEVIQLYPEGKYLNKAKKMLELMR